MNNEKIVFFDKLGVFSMIFRGALNGDIDAYYFDISRSAKALIYLLGLQERVKFFNFNLAELRGSQGQSYYPRICGEDLIELCDKIEKEVIGQDPLIMRFADIFDRRKIEIFFRKTVEDQLMEAIVLMNAIKWWREKELDDKAQTIVFYMEKCHLLDQLKAFGGQRYNLNIIGHRSLAAARRTFSETCESLGVFLCALVGSLAGGPAPKYTFDKRERPVRLGIPYREYGICFDQMHRTNFPWLLMSGVPFKNVLVYFDYDAELTGREIADLRENGIDFVATRKRAIRTNPMPLYRPTWLVAQKMLNVLWRMAPGFIREICFLRFSALNYLNRFARFTVQYARAYDFFLNQNIKLNINIEDYNPYVIAESAALNEVGAVSISYQRSSWSIPSGSVGSCADVIFLFGPYYHEIIRKSGSDNDVIVFCGFITDYAFKTVKDKALALRENLHKNGAKFIICYFDENSVDKRTSILPHRVSEYIYGKLLKWVLREQDIGIVFKPKKIATLLNRIPIHASLVEKAKATGRCVFLGNEGGFDIWPTEAAQSSDVTVGHLVSSSTVLESILSGVRSVYLDMEGLYSYPEYRRGRDKVVFDDVDKLIKAIDNYRSNTNGFGDIGDASVIEDLVASRDPFRDGNATSRMGQYIKWIFDGYAAGRTKEDVMNMSADRYAETWGNNNIVRRQKIAGWSNEAA